MDLLQNPFHILNASTRDNRRRILELADERSLSFDSNEYRVACSVLTIPRKRLAAEIAWLPGVGPKRVREILSLIDSSPTDLLSVDNLSSIARVNLLASGLSRLSAYNSDDVAEWILKIAWGFEGLDSNELSVIINEERIVSGFPEISDNSVVREEIQGRRNYYRQVIKSALDELPSKELVAVVTAVVESATKNGDDQGPILIADIIDSYEVEAQGFLNKEEDNIRILVDKLLIAADAEQPDSTLSPIVDQLIKVMKNWDAVAQPIQVSTKSRGLNHDASHRVAGLVRDLAICLYNEHSKLDFSQQLTSMLQDVFAEVGGVAERSAEDAVALDEIAEQRKLSRLLEPISALCTTALENTEKQPSTAYEEAKKIINSAPQLIAKLSEVNVDIEIISEGKDEIALTLMHCAVFYGNNTEKWSPCIALLEEAFKYASSQEVESKIQKNLNTVRENNRLYSNLTPVLSAPSLRRINGIGTTLYGSTDHDFSSGSYLTTYYFIFFAIPIFPICRYRVISTGNVYHFLGKAPLRVFDKWHIAISLGLIALGIISVQ